MNSQKEKAHSTTILGISEVDHSVLGCGSIERGQCTTLDPITLYWPSV